MSLIWILLNNEAKLFGFSLSVSLPSTAPLCQWSLLVKSYPNAHVQPKQHILKAHVSFQSEWYLVRFAPCSRWFWSVISPTLRNQSHESKLKKTCVAHSSWPSSGSGIVGVVITAATESSLHNTAFVQLIYTQTCALCEQLHTLLRRDAAPKLRRESLQCWWQCADLRLSVGLPHKHTLTHTHSRADMMHPPPLGWDDER